MNQEPSKVDHTVFDRGKWNVWHKNHPLIWHWRLNPGIAFNEVILGQRMPEVSIVDKQSGEAECDSTYIPCPHCNELNSSRLYAQGNVFKNWFGLYCGHCKEQIPTVTNIFSYVLLAITFPIWIWVNICYKETLISQSINRTQSLRAKLDAGTLPTAKDISFIKVGVEFGVYFFVGMALFSLFVLKATFYSLLVLFVCSILAGILFGVFMKLVMGTMTNKRT